MSWYTYSLKLATILITREHIDRLLRDLGILMTNELQKCVTLIMVDNAALHIAESREEMLELSLIRFPTDAPDEQGSAQN